jgi:hypothetical protein
MVAAGSFEVAADAPGIARYRRESTDASEAVSGVEGLHISAGGGEEFGAEDNAEAGHAQDDFGVAVAAKSLLDHRLGVGDFGVSRFITSSASRATIAAARSCPGSTVCWAWAASSAAAATASALRVLRFRSQAPAARRRRDVVPRAFGNR